MSVGATSLLTEGDVDRGRPLDVAPSCPTALVRYPEVMRHPRRPRRLNRRREAPARALQPAVGELRSGEWIGVQRFISRFPHPPYR